MKKLTLSTLLIFLLPQLAFAASKELYLSIPTTDTARQIQRTLPTGASSTNTQQINNLATADFPLSPALADDLNVLSGSHSVILRMACTRRCGGGTQKNRTVNVLLQYGSGASWTTLGSQSQSFTMGNVGVYATYTYTINVGSDTNVPSGQQLRVLVENNSGVNNANITIVPLNGGIYSRAIVDTSTFVNVDSTEEYTATYPGATPATYFDPLDTAYIRGVVSDPFGSFDITSATITIVDAVGTTRVTNAAMTEVFDSGTNSKTYEYAYVVPTPQVFGYWSYTITANEGTEGTVTHQTGGTFHVGDPNLFADLSTSTKDFVDINGGEADPGDTLRYTIAIINTSTTAATGVVVSDDIPALQGSLSVVSTPAGSTDSSTGSGTGANGTGYLNITNFNVAAMSTVIIVYDVTVSGSANPGDVINNIATVTPSSGSGANPNSSVTVSPSQVPTSGNKDLYLSIPVTNTTRQIQRTQPVGANSTNTQTINNAANADFPLTPAFAAAFTVSAGNQSVVLRMACNNRCGGGAQKNRIVNVLLQYGSGASWTTIGSQSQNFTMGNAGVYSTYTYTINVASNTNISAGQQLRILIENNSGVNNANIRVVPLNGGIYSRAIVSTFTVINVDTATAYNQVYPSASTALYYDGLATVFLRGVVSDPFGSFDITSATIVIRDSANNILVNGAAMTQVADSGLDTKTYEYQYTIPAAGPGGDWNFTITANEGNEGTISNSTMGIFRVGFFVPTIVKNSSVISDGVNVSNPKRIPRAVLQNNISLTNTGMGVNDPTTLVITNVIPSEVSMCVSTTCASGADPVQLLDGTPSSGLSLTYSTDVSYSNQVGGGPPYTYLPVPNVNGYDSAVTGIRIAPPGSMNGSNGTPPHPSFTIIYRTRIK